MVHPGSTRVGPVPGARILLVEDDESLRLTTRLILERYGYEVVTAADGVEGLHRLVDAPDLAVVDVTMPRMDGLTFARHVRERQELPIVFLTARDLPRDQLAGFDAGADDYVVKPFDGRLLAARIAAVLRRTAASQPDDPAIALGELRIDLDAMTVHRAGEPVSLSSTEFRLFETLLLNANRVLTRGQLLDHVWGGIETDDTHVIEVTIQRLRAKIGSDHIATVRGVGYRLVRP